MKITHKMALAANAGKVAGSGTGKILGRLLSLKLGRKLETWEEADHIDEDVTNDNPDNIQLLTRKENIAKSNSSRGNAPKLELICPQCKKVFIKLKSEIKGNNTYCSKECFCEFNGYRINPPKSKTKFRIRGNE